MSDKPLLSRGLPISPPAKVAIVTQYEFAQLANRPAAILVIGANSGGETEVRCIAKPTIDDAVFCLSLSQMSSGWRGTANRVMLSPDVGRLQSAVVAAHRVIPITSVT